jgi:hypothetical protein
MPSPSAECNATLVRVASVITVGLILNRLDVSLVAYRWNEADRVFPKLARFTVTLTIVTVGLLTFRWIVNRVPVLRDHPAFEQALAVGGQRRLHADASRIHGVDEPVNISWRSPLSGFIVFWRFGEWGK